MGHFRGIIISLLRNEPSGPEEKKSPEEGREGAEEKKERWGVLPSGTKAPQEGRACSLRGQSRRKAYISY